MSKSPISDLFAKPQPPVSSAPSNNGGPGNWVVTTVLLSVLGLALWMRFQESFQFPPRPDDEKRQVQPDGDKQKDKQSGKVSALGCWVVIVEETADRKSFPHIASVQNDLDFWNGLQARGIIWRFYDRDSPAIQPYLADAEKAGLPALLVISPEPGSKVLAAKSCPPTTASIEEVLNGVIAK